MRPQTGHNWMVQNVYVMNGTVVLLQTGWSTAGNIDSWHFQLSGRVLPSKLALQKKPGFAARNPVSSLPSLKSGFFFKTRFLLTLTTDQAQLPVYPHLGKIIGGGAHQHKLAQLTAVITDPGLAFGSDCVFSFIPTKRLASWMAGPGIFFGNIA